MGKYYIKYSFSEGAFDLADNIEWQEGTLRHEEMIGKSVTWQITQEESYSVIWIKFTLTEINNLLEGLLDLVKQNPKNVPSIRALIFHNNWLTEEQIRLLDCMDMFL